VKVEESKPVSSVFVSPGFDARSGPNRSFGRAVVVGA
jgi:hypothetical protein